MESRKNRIKKNREGTFYAIPLDLEGCYSLMINDVYVTNTINEKPFNVDRFKSDGRQVPGEGITSLLRFRKKGNSLLVIPCFGEMERNIQCDRFGFGLGKSPPREWLTDGILEIDKDMVKLLLEVFPAFPLEQVQEITEKEHYDIIWFEEYIKPGIYDRMMSAESKKSEAVVRQYAKGLSTLDLDLIASILPPEFKFVYWMHHRDPNVRIIAHPNRLKEAISRNLGRGHAIRTDVRYIGHLYRTFLEMKKEGLSVKTDFFHTEIAGEKILCIKLLPPHYRGIIYPMDYQIREEYRGYVHDEEVCMLPRIKNGMLCKIESYNSMELFVEFDKPDWLRPLGLLSSV